MSRAHNAWLKALIETIPAVSAKTFDTTNELIAKTPPPFVVIHSASGIDTATRQSSGVFTQNPRWVIHSVGSDASQAAAVGEAIKALLIQHGIGITPTIQGERPDPVWWRSPLPVQVDKEVTPWLCFHVAEVGFSSNPA